MSLKRKPIQKKKKKQKNNFLLLFNFNRLLELPSDVYMKYLPTMVKKTSNEIC